jgi:hydroxymethylglutaryl-CoA synthase
LGAREGRIGIEALRFYPCSGALPIAELCAARGMDSDHARSEWLVDERGVAPPWEDAVTLAVNAARPLMTEDTAAEVGLLIVGSETSVDQEKPISSWVHHHLGLPSDCRNFEVKHACYGATAGVQMAISWLASPMSHGRKALVISSDLSLLGLGAPWEAVLGGGAAAVLLSKKPRLLAYELGASGVYAHEVHDVIRPTPRIETGNSEESLFSYLEAVDAAYEAYERQVGEIDFDEHFAANVYHTPFGGMAWRAHRSLLRRTGRVTEAEDAWRHFQRKALASLLYTRRTGGTYGASTFVALLGLLAGMPHLREGDRIGIFAYGSGSCAEFYSGLLLDEAHQVAAEAGLPDLLDARRTLSQAQYEAWERERDSAIGLPCYHPDWSSADGWYSEGYEGRGLLVLRRVDDYYRVYDWS